MLCYDSTSCDQSRRDPRGPGILPSMQHQAVMWTGVNCGCLPKLLANKRSEAQLCCSCGLKSKAPLDKDGGQEPDKKEEEEPQLEHALWEAKLKFLQVACILGTRHC